MWATLGNILRLSAFSAFLLTGLAGYRAITLNQVSGPRDEVILYAVAAIVSFVMAVLLWNLKGPLISGNFVVRSLVGLYFLIGIVGSLGLSLIFIGIVYLFTSEPEIASNYGYRSDAPPRPKISPPRGWRQTGTIGPSGAMAYGDEHRDGSTEIFDSWTPVQVTDRKNGLAHVVAATGQRGWIDVRTLTQTGV
jgi:hypothetical protein